jgi:hypothetical protein
MSQAAAKAPQVESQTPQSAPMLRQRKIGIVGWLRSWSQVLVAELLRLMERRHGD